LRGHKFAYLLRGGKGEGEFGWKREGKEERRRKGGGDWSVADP